MDDATIEAQLAQCGSIRKSCLAMIRKSEKIIRNLDEYTDDLKNRRFDELDLTVEEFENSEVDDGDDRKDIKSSRTSFKRDRAVQQSRLLSLAPEIRNMIWKLCLFHPDDLTTKLEGEKYLRKKHGCVTMTIAPGSYEARPKVVEAYEGSAGKRTRQLIREHSLRNLELMQTCQDVYNETAPFLWSQRFYFRNAMHLQAFLLSNARLDLVRDVFVLRLDRQCGVNYMPAVCALLADKVKGLERLEVDMSNMDKSGPQHVLGPLQVLQKRPFLHRNELRRAGVKLGFDVYSCMYPWVTKVVRDQGIEKLMAILQIPRQTGETLHDKNVHMNWRTHNAFSRGVKLNADELKIANTGTAREILRLVNLYDK